MKYQIINLFVFLSLHLIGQDSFSKYYTFDSNGSTFRTMLIERDTILLEGYFLDTISSFRQGIVFAKIDSSGNLISYTKYFDTTGRDYTYNPLNNLIKISDGRFLTLNMTLQGNALQLLFLKPNFTLDTIFEFFSNDQSVQLNWWRCIYEVDDGFLVFGSAQRLNFNDDIQLIKISRSGELIWRKWLGLNNKDEVVGDVVKYSDSTFLIASFRKPFPVPTSDIRKSTWIFEVDTSGKIIQEFIDTDPFSGGSGGIVLDKYYNIYYSGSSIVQDEFGNYNTLGKVGKLNSNFISDWKRNFGKNFNPMTGLSDMILSKGQLIASGIYVDSSRNSLGGPSGYTGGWLTVSSLTGDSICERIDTAQWFISDGTGMGFFRAIDTLSTGSIITCGDGRFSSDSDVYHDFAWLAKTGTPPCKGLMVNGEDEFSTVNEFSVFPNPSIDEIEISISIENFLLSSKSMIHISDLTGRVWASYILLDFQQKLDICSLPKGIYVISFENKDRTIAFKRFVKW